MVGKVSLGAFVTLYTHFMFISTYVIITWISCLIIGTSIGHCTTYYTQKMWDNVGIELGTKL